jgi:hypothetical protein
VAAGAALAFVVLSRDPGTRTILPLTAGADTVVVVDLSASINTDAYARIGATLDSLARGGGRLGLVLFSDEAYEALPAGTPARDLLPFVRYFRPLRPSTSPVQTVMPTNPWQSTFSGGTRISAGLQLARGLATAAAGRAQVLLLSDLDDSEPDRRGLTAVLLGYKRDRLPLRVVGLDPSAGNISYFRNLLGTGVTVRAAPRPAEVHERTQTPFPWSLAALLLAAAAVLAVAALWAPTLEWRR